jgi:hypothetical protein
VQKTQASKNKKQEPNLSAGADIKFEAKDVSFPRRRLTQHDKQRRSVQLHYHNSTILPPPVIPMKPGYWRRQGGIHLRSDHFATLIINNSDASFPPRRRLTQHDKQRCSV